MTILSHWEKNRQQARKGPTGTSQITPRQEQQSGMAKNGSRITEGAENRLKEEKSTIKQGLALERSKL